MIRAQLTPAQWAAWQILQRLPDTDLLRRPGSALAGAMQIPARNARIHLHALTAEKLVSRVGTQGICVVVPARGSQILVARQTISKDCRYAQKLPVSPPGGGSELRGVNSDPPLAVTWRDPRGIRDAVSAVVFSSSDLEEEERPKKRGTAPAEIARRLKKVQALVGESPRGPTPRPETTTEGRYFVQLYVERRRRVDPEYAETPRDVVKLASTLRLFEKRKVGRALWGRYLDHVFESFEIVTRGRCIYPPVGQVASETWIDSYVATLGKRPRDLDQVFRMLAGAGFKTDRCDAYIAMSLADRQVQKKRMPPDLHEDPHLHAMVQWLAERVAEIGYDDDPDGDLDAGKGG